MTEAITWIIIALFYAPIHYLLPVLVTLMRSSENARRTAVIGTLLDCTLSMVFSFTLATWLISKDRVTAAMAVLLVSMALPYIRVLARRSGNGNTDPATGPAGDS